MSEQLNSNTLLTSEEEEAGLKVFWLRRYADTGRLFIIADGYERGRPSKRMCWTAARSWAEAYFVFGFPLDEELEKDYAALLNDRRLRNESLKEFDKRLQDFIDNAYDHAERRMARLAEKQLDLIVE